MRLGGEKPFKVGLRDAVRAVWTRGPDGEAETARDAAKGDSEAKGLSVTEQEKICVGARKAEKEAASALPAAQAEHAVLPELL